MAADSVTIEADTRSGRIENAAATYLNFGGSEPFGHPLQGQPGIPIKKSVAHWHQVNSTRSHQIEISRLANICFSHPTGDQAFDPESYSGFSVKIGLFAELHRGSTKK
jgi:hypothetical protein